tara:strand:- start:128 stop:331 length:204 start_codon:yes stop_codon:yes gene_type:complete
MEINLEKRINELEARHSFQEDSIERLSSEVRKQQQEIGILKEKLAAAFDLLHKGNDIEDDNEKPPHY